MGVAKFCKCDEWLQKVKMLETEGGFHGLESVERVTPDKHIFQDGSSRKPGGM